MPFARDQSLVIMACPGIRREAEFIANEIWSLISADERRHKTSPGQLRFRDIAVLVADSVSRPAYQAHVRRL